MVPVSVRTVRETDEALHLDVVAVEEPLEIRVVVAGESRVVSITMRTPGHDTELAAGFLFAEGLLQSHQDITAVRRPAPNSVELAFLPRKEPDLDRLHRNFYMTSSCGVCGKASLEAVGMAACPILPCEADVVDPAVLHSLPEALRDAQPVFDKTGGLHGAGLFDFAGKALSVREDVGRHNAVDKLIGSEFLAGRTPLSERILLVSGRASFELVQKAIMGGIPILAAVGAPSSLAVELAQRFRMTLIGFLKRDRFNIYSGASRVRSISK